MKKLIAGAGLAWAMVAGASPAMAQAAAAAATACELHVFPTLEGQAMTSGWLGGMGIIGAVAEAAANKDKNLNEAQYLREALGPGNQVTALKAIDLAKELGLPASQVTFETPIADRHVSTQAQTRLTASKADCYAELLVTQNFYQKAAIYGRSLSNRFIYKDFRTGKSTTALVKGRGGNGLKFFPPKTTDQTEQAEQELREVFGKNFIEFAHGMRTPVR